MSQITAVDMDFRTVNAAFEDDARPEIARILRDLADRFENAGVQELEGDYTIRDINGNQIGRMWVGVEGDEGEEDENSIR